MVCCRPRRSTRAQPHALCDALAAGTKLTASMILERLEKEARTNVGLEIASSPPQQGMSDAAEVGSLPHDCPFAPPYCVRDAREVHSESTCQALLLTPPRCLSSAFRFSSCTP
jgi:hypothetical protein